MTSEVVEEADSDWNSPLSLPVAELVIVLQCGGHCRCGRWVKGVKASWTVGVIDRLIPTQDAPVAPLSFVTFYCEAA